jgi:hypothetical protein
MATTLERAVEPHEIVAGLRRFGVAQRDVAAATRVSDRAGRAWRAGGIHDESYDRLQDVRDIVLVLADSLTARGVGQWLHARNRLLDGARPTDVLADGRVDDVRQSARSFVDGAYV